MTSFVREIGKSGNFKAGNYVVNWREIPVAFSEDCLVKYFRKV